jgi:hypothetical protein
MPRAVRTIDEIMSRRRKDTYFLQFHGAFIGFSSLVRQKQLEWLAANGIGVEPTAPAGWMEGDAGIHALDCDRDDPRILAYAGLYEDAEGKSLDPETYQMWLKTYGG